MEAFHIQQKSGERYQLEKKMQAYCDKGMIDFLVYLKRFFQHHTLLIRTETT